MNSRYIFLVKRHLRAEGAATSGAESSAAGVVVPGARGDDTLASSEVLGGRHGHGQRGQGEDGDEGELHLDGRDCC